MMDLEALLGDSTLQSVKLQEGYIDIMIKALIF
jgi:hypothetical protein